MRPIAAILLLGLTGSNLLAQAPTLNFWDGLNQSFGVHGNPQRWVNVLGNVTNKSAVTSLTYTLNGGAAVQLNIGKNGRRLLSDGDFNVDIDRALLNNGANTLFLQANTAGGPVTETVTLNYQAGNVWPGNYAIDWSTVTRTTDVIQIVDGPWAHTAAGARTTTPGYDRTFVVGDVTWQNFEVVVPITVHGLDPSPDKYSSISVSPGFGFTGRWTGHTQLQVGEQPLQYWLPQGGGPWYDFGKQNKPSRFFLAGSDGLFIDDPQNRTVSFGTKYWWKLRVETLPNGNTWYGLKLWEDGGSEPVMFDISGTEGTNDLQNGSIIFVAHHVDMTVGNLQTAALSSDTVPPVMAGAGSDPASSSCAVSWLTDEPADGTVAYGKTTNYELGTVVSSALVTSHQLTLTGLEASTDYHFKITTKDGRGNSESSADMIFTTAGSGGGGGGSQPPQSDLETDTFDGSELDPAKWITVDPLLDASFGVSGGKLSITASAAATHDVWTSANDLPRAMRQAPNADFDVQVKFDSPLATGSGEFRSQGILVEESASHVLRLEFHSVNGVTKVFAARLKNGAAKTYRNLTVSSIGSSTVPMYLRVTRVGDIFKLLYSVDGLAWSQAVSFSNPMAPVAIGVYGGNGAGVTHTAVVDTFQVNSVGSGPDLTPPVISGVAAVPTATGATITWSTGEPATSLVEFGLTNSYGDSEDNGSALNVSHSLALTGLASNTTYHYRVLSTDAAGNLRTDVDRTFTTSSDTTPPSISNIGVTPGSNAATVSWGTDEPATSVVNYGLTAAFGSTADNGSTLSSSHSIAIPNLTPDTVYHYRITSVDASGNASHSTDRTFTTSSGGGGGGLSSDEFDTLDLSRWTFVNPLNDSSASASNGKVNLSIPASTTIHDAWTSSNHCPRITQDVPDSDFDVEAVFTSGLPGLSFKSQGVMIEQDPLNIIRIEFHQSNGSTNVFVATIFGGSATVRKYQSVALSVPMSLRVIRAGNSWTIQRTVGGGGYSSVASFNQSMTVNKIGVFAGCSVDAHQASVDRFLVHSGSGGGDLTPPQIDSIQVAGANVSWATDEPATSQVRYGLTNGLELAPVSSGALVTTHGLTLPNLLADTQYFYQVVSVDAAGNAGNSSILTFTTAGSGGLQSDQFNVSPIDLETWSFLDAQGDCSVTASGGQAQIVLPGTEVIRDVWTSSNNVARLMQEAPDTDWTVEAKFDSVLSGPSFKSQGILVEVDPTNVIRCEFLQSGGQTYVFCASIIGGTAQVRAFTSVAPSGSTYLRLARSGSSWSLRYSLDGTHFLPAANFSLPITPMKVGVYAGTDAHTPHTALIDYFEVL